jgi:type IV fimbrial biogenesis protein FimT
MKMSSVSTSRSYSGFTLVELVIALSIAAILAAIAVPSFQETIASQRVRAAASALYGSLIYARSEAIKRNWPVSLIATNLASGWSVQPGNDATNCTPAGDAARLKSQESFNGLTFTPSPALSVPAFCYNSIGRLQSNTETTVKISGTGTSRCWSVMVDSSGRPSVTEGGC